MLNRLEGSRGMTVRTLTVPYIRIPKSLRMGLGNRKGTTLGAMQINSLRSARSKSIHITLPQLGFMK